MINPGDRLSLALRVIIILFVGMFLLFFSSCVKRERQIAVQSNPSVSASEFPLININSAARDTLDQLPGIGPALADRIIEHRERYGRFRRAEHLIMVRGLSDRRFRELRSRIVVE